MRDGNICTQEGLSGCAGSVSKRTEISHKCNFLQLVSMIRYEMVLDSAKDLPSRIVLSIIQNFLGPGIRQLEAEKLGKTAKMAVRTRVNANAGEIKKKHWTLFLSLSFSLFLKRA